MAVVDADVSALFIEHSRKMLMDQYWPRLRECVQSLSEEQVWWRPNAACNSVGNLVLHLNGNVRQWLVSSFNGGEDRRERPTEFSRQEGILASALVATLGATLEEAVQVLARLTKAELGKRYEIQGYHVSGLEAVYQVVEHFGLHYGQVLYITKALSAVDLGYYRELDETGRSS